MPEQPTTDPTPTVPETAPTIPEATTSTTSDPTAEAAPSAQPAEPVAPGAAAAPSAASGPSASSSRRKKILSAIGTVAVVLLAKFGLGYLLSDKPAADSLSIGQCVQRGDDDSIGAVDCGDSKADYKVVFIKKDTVESAADQICAPYEATTTTYFESEKGETQGNTICLGPVR